MNLITLKQLKAHVSQDTNFDDKMLERIRRDASYVILDYLKIDTGDTSFDWCDALGEPSNTIPGVVRAATLMAAGAMYENRDGSTVGVNSPQVLSQSVVDMLMRSRDPALA